MEEQNGTVEARLAAFLIDWLIWAYMPSAVIYYLRKPLKGLPIVSWLYVGAIVLGLMVALIAERAGTTIGERIKGLVPELSEEDGATKRPPWYCTQIGVTAAALAVITFVLGWQITEVNLYYVFTRADRMQNMTDRLLRPYWPVLGSLIEKLIETIFLALMATAIAIPLSAFISFFAARNIMYRITMPWGKTLGGLVGAIVGAVLGARLVSLLTSGLSDQVFDVRLISGMLAPLALIVGMVALGILGSRLLERLLMLPHRWPARVGSALMCGVLGGVAAYLVGGLVSMVVFAGSWRIFVRDLSPWPYVLLAAGFAVGIWYDSKHRPEEDFELGRVVYTVVRFVLNTTRSIEPFVWALIFVTWFRLGPFPGMVALMVHSVAALGKLYSEQIESIDPGPVEAVRATGANELQTVLYAVVPQIIPPFISFTIYRWDINVRMSTIIGLVGGGGIGQLLFQYQNLGQWRRTSVAIILIVTVVMMLDNMSARIRERIL